MDLVYECFVKLGLRYVCVTRDGRYAGLVSPHCPFLTLIYLSSANMIAQIHKKTFVKYIRELEEEEAHL